MAMAEPFRYSLFFHRVRCIAWSWGRENVHWDGNTPIDLAKQTQGIGSQSLNSYTSHYSITNANPHLFIELWRRATITNQPPSLASTAHITQHMLVTQTWSGICTSARTSFSFRPPSQSNARLGSLFCCRTCPTFHPITASGVPQPLRNHAPRRHFSQWGLISSVS